MKRIESALKMITGVSALLTLYAAINLAVHHFFWQVAIPWYLFGLVVMWLVSFYLYKRYNQTREALVTHLIFSLFYAIIWLSMLIFFVTDELFGPNRPRRLNGNHC